MKEIKQKVQKKCVVKTKLKFEDYKKCLKASKIINIINYLEKKGMNVDSLKEHKNEFIKNNLLSKSQQRFKSKRHSVFTEEINRVTLSPNNDKRIRSINSIETYSHGMSKELIWKR